MKQEKLDRLLNTALWWKQIRETNNTAFLPLFFDEHRYLVLKGGGGSGKSIFAGRKVLERVTSEPGHRWLVCRKVARTLRESCFEQLRGQIADFYPNAGARVNKSDMNITFRNGSKIIFAGLDDVEKLKSIYDITGIWIEEASELEEGDFNQLDIRLRTDFPYYLQMILSFNPISITHWLKKRFFDRPDPRARLHESTYKDNRFLTGEAIRTLEAFRDTDEYYYMVYCLGQWGVTGKTVFNAKAVAERLDRIGPPAAEGFFEYDAAEDGVHIGNIRWTEEAGGPIKVYRPPVKGRPYVVGGDTAGDGSDWFVGQVLDNRTGEQVAVLHHQFGERMYAEQMYCLGMYYNTALIGVETNYSTYPEMKLEDLGYPNLYVRERLDNYTGKMVPAFGFETTTVTRPVIVDGLKDAAREHLETINDYETLGEMLTFIYDENWKPQAEEGAHDDLVMALAIAHKIRVQQRTSVERTAAAGTAVWTQDMWDDFDRADPQGRELLLKLWGTPRR